MKPDGDVFRMFRHWSSHSTQKKTPVCTRILVTTDWVTAMSVFSIANQVCTHTWIPLLLYMALIQLLTRKHFLILHLITTIISEAVITMKTPSFPAFLKGIRILTALRATPLPMLKIRKRILLLQPLCRM